MQRRRLRYWWLPYGFLILCPICYLNVIPVEEVWCGCGPLPRKLKKWCKGRRKVYEQHPSELYPYGYHATGVCEQC